MSFSVDPLLATKVQEFADSVGMSRSNLINKLLEKFLYAHEKAELVNDPCGYITKTHKQSSYYCPTQLGDIDFVVTEEEK